MGLALLFREFESQFEKRETFYIFVFDKKKDNQNQRPTQKRPKWY